MTKQAQRKERQCYVRMNKRELDLAIMALRYCEREARIDLRPDYKALRIRMEGFQP